NSPPDDRSNAAATENDGSACTLAFSLTSMPPLSTTACEEPSREAEATASSLSEVSARASSCGAERIGNKAATKSCQSMAAETEHTVRANVATVVAALARKPRRLGER